MKKSFYQNLELEFRLYDVVDPFSKIEVKRNWQYSKVIETEMDFTKILGGMYRDYCEVNSSNYSVERDILDSIHEIGGITVFLNGQEGLHEAEQNY